MRNNKILSGLLFLYFLVLANLYFYGMGATGLAIPRNNITWLWVLSYIGFTLLIVKNKLLYTKNDLKLFLSFLVIIFPFFFNEVVTDVEPFYKILALLLALLLFFSLMQNDIIVKNPELLLIFILLAGIIQMFHGAYQTFGAIAFNFYAGEIAFNPAPLGVFNQKNVFASFIALAITVCFYLNCICEVKLKPIIKNVLTFFILFIGGFLIIYSNSRAGYLGLLSGLLLMSYSCYKANSKVFIKLVITLLLGLVIAMTTIYVQGNVEKDFTSGGVRQDIYLVSLKSISDAPIMGHGLGSFESTFRDKIIDLNKSGELQTGEPLLNFNHPHNELLYWGIEGGIISILGLISILVIALRRIAFSKMLCYLGLLSPIAIHAMVEMPFLISSLHLVSITLILLFISITNRQIEEILFSKNAILVIKIPAIIILGLCASFLFMNFRTTLQVEKFISTQGKAPLVTGENVTVLGWKLEFDFLMYSNALFNSTDLEQLKINAENYIRWAERSIHSAPRVEFYNNLIRSYIITGQFDKAKVEADLLEVRFPNFDPDGQWRKAFEKELSENLPTAN